MKKIISLGVVFVLVFSVGLVIADNTGSKGKATVDLPENAVKVAPNVYSLGKAMDKGKVVEGYAFVHYKNKKRFAKPGTECGNNICEPGENARKCPQDCGGGGATSRCYGFLAKGAKWKSVEPYLVNPNNSRGLGDTFVMSNLADDIGKWETAASFDILGVGSKTSEVLAADLVRPDDKNEVYFGNIQEPGAVGITIVWGIFRGHPDQRELVEWDQVYDEVDYDWSSNGEQGKMDFENVATHELGHSVGLDDLYEGTCSEETMYGNVDYGETKKRTLESGDITGVKELYK